MKNKNSGFSLFTVLIAVAFLSIMGLLLLYISVANFQIQTTDLKGTDSFYTAEQALEEIRAGLQQDVGEAMSAAYLSVMENYSVDDSTDESLDDQRLALFTEKYLGNLVTTLSGTTTAESGTAATATPAVTSATQTKLYSLEHLKSYVDLTVSEYETLLITYTDSGPEMEVGTESGVLLKNIKVIYVDERGRSSIIQTDIRLGIPNIEFPTPSTLPDLMNMIVVAGSGIECVSPADGSSGTVTINGSVYAGSMKDGTTKTGVSILVDSNQTLTISGGDQVVCEGAVEAESGSTFTASEDVTLWASGVTLSSAVVKLLGKTYIADDLTVESGKNSTVTISGEYYGYGSPDSAKASHNNYNSVSGQDPDSTKGEKGVLDNKSDASLSSSIIINGKNTTMDLTGVTKLMLAGRSYVGTETLNGLITVDGEATGTANTGGSNILMGESLTVKGTQIAYLLPSALLQSGDDTEALTNPMSYTQYQTSSITIDEESETIKDLYKSNEFAFIDRTAKVAEWGDKTIDEIGVDSEYPVKAVFYADNSSGGYVYFYLNFTDESKAAAFMQSYYQENSEIKAVMDKYLSFYFPNTGNGITMKDEDTYLRYITAGNYIINGNILTYSGVSASDGSAGVGSGNLLEGSDEDEDTSLFATQKGYQNMWYALNRKMIGSYDLLETTVKDSEGNFDHNETKANRSVFDNLVNEDAMLKFIYKYGKTNSDETQYYEFKDSESGLKAIFADNGSETNDVSDSDSTSVEAVAGSGKTLTITAEDSSLRLVVCTGDVLIKSGVNFQGIIMAKGKITLEAGASLSSMPTEAAKVFQAQMAAESSEYQVAPRDFFWDGEDYVLGSSSSSSSGSSSSQSETYDISDAITYENWKKM